MRFVDKGHLSLRYCLQVRPEAIRLPAAAPEPGPADLLWQHTCCEAFIARPESDAYREFNFSPSGQWAVYDFSDYRQPCSSTDLAAQPWSSTQVFAEYVLLDALIPTELLPDGPLCIGLSAVIEAIDGSKSYWALTHCAEQPNFHLRQSFTLTF